MLQTEVPRRHDRSSQKTERFFVRFGVYSFIGFIAFIALIWGGVRVSRHIQIRRLLEQGKAAFAKGDDRWASITSRRVWELDNHNVDAARLLAQVVERQNHPSAVDWRREVVKLAPNSVEDKIALAKTAMLFGQLTVAETTLQELQAEASKTAVYHETAAQLAISKKDPIAAEAHISEALRLDPKNQVYQLNREVFRLQSKSPETRTAAMEKLRTFLDDPKVRLPAARALRDYALQRHDTGAILDIAGILNAYTEATLQDRIFYARVLHQLGHPDFARQLNALQEEASSDALKLCDVLNFMSNDRLSLVALDWIKTLPTALVAQQPVPIAVADCYVAIKDWASLRDWCKQGSWNANETLRHVYLARAAREERRTFDFETEWNSVLKEAGTDVEKISRVQQIIVRWEWKPEAETLLWALANDSVTQLAALEALYQNYLASGQTNQLFRVLARLLELRPTDPKTKNNFAQIALLLNVEIARANQIAQELHQTAPSNAVFASTYAFALYQKGRMTQALEAFRPLTPEQLKEPSTALYYGLVLAANGETRRAADCLTLAAQAHLLPEEKALLEKADRSIAQ